MGKISKKTCKKFIFVMLFIVLITLVGIFFYRNREGLDTNRVGTAKGGWGGSCTCPDGQVYQVSDNDSGGKELACYGGISGKINRFTGPWSGKSVTCAPKVKASEPKGQTLKDYVYNSVNQKITDLKKLYNCQVGQGNNKVIAQSNSVTYESCAKECDQNKNCKAFDFTTKNLSTNNSCRLYDGKVPPRESGGSDNRQYCSLNQKQSDLNDPTPPEAPGCYILLPDGCPNHPSTSTWTAKKNIWQLDEAKHKSGKNKQICDKRAEDFNHWCNIKNAQSFFRK